MPESKVISTITSLEVSGSDIAIITSYLDISLLPFTIQSRIAEEDGIQDGVSYLNGELLLRMINSPEHIDYIIDSNGNLILICDTGDADNYSINSDGELIYTTIE